MYRVSNNVCSVQEWLNNDSNNNIYPRPCVKNPGAGESGPHNPHTATSEISLILQAQTEEPLEALRPAGLAQAVGARDPVSNQGEGGDPCLWLF